MQATRLWLIYRCMTPHVHMFSCESSAWGRGMSERGHCCEHWIMTCNWIKGLTGCDDSRISGVSEVICRSLTVYIYPSTTSWELQEFQTIQTWHGWPVSLIKEMGNEFFETLESPVSSLYRTSNLWYQGTKSLLAVTKAHHAIYNTRQLDCSKIVWRL